MKRTRFTEEQIVYALKLAESGTWVAVTLCSYSTSSDSHNVGTKARKKALVRS